MLLRKEKSYVVKASSLPFPVKVRVECDVIRIMSKIFHYNDGIHDTISLLIQYYSKLKVLYTNIFNCTSNIAIFLNISLCVRAWIILIRHN